MPYALDVLLLKGKDPGGRSAPPRRRAWAPRPGPHVLGCLLAESRGEGAPPAPQKALAQPRHVACHHKHLSNGRKGHSLANGLPVFSQISWRGGDPGARAAQPSAPVSNGQLHAGLLPLWPPRVWQTCTGCPPPAQSWALADGTWPCPREPYGRDGAAGRGPGATQWAGEPGLTPCGGRGPGPAAPDAPVIGGPSGKGWTQCCSSSPEAQSCRPSHTCPLGMKRKGCPQRK